MNKPNYAYYARLLRNTMKFIVPYVENDRNSINSCVPYAQNMHTMLECAYLMLMTVHIIRVLISTYLMVANDRTTYKNVHKNLRVWKCPLACI